MKLNIRLIKREMRAAGITQADVARAWKVSPQAVSDVMRRRPITFADKFGKLLKLDAKSLID
jgi:transcriptional regulator with XRE-family HTH domain